jgi:hypothetical protein
MAAQLITYHEESGEKCPAKDGGGHYVRGIMNPKHSNAYYIQHCNSCDNVVLRLESEREYLEWSTDVLSPQEGND